MRITGAVRLPLFMICVAAAGAVLASQGVSSQTIPAIPGVPPSAQPAPAEPSPAPPADPARASARATMRTFVEAFFLTKEQADGDPIRRAVGCLDLGGLPEPLWASKGPELAIHLKDVLDRIEHVNVDEIPDDPAGLPYVFYRSADGEIVISRVATGEWLFSRATVASIPGLLRAVGDREPVAEAQNEPRLETPFLRIRERIPQVLKSKGFVLEHWQWIALALLAFLGYAVMRLSAWLLAQTAGRLICRRWPSVQMTLVRKGCVPIGLLAMAAMWNGALGWLGLPLWMHSAFVVAVRLTTVVATVWTIFGVVDLFVFALRARAEKSDVTFDVLLVPIVRTSLRIVTGLIALAVFARNFNIEITGLLAGLGLGGVAIALAAKDTFGNFFGSLTVILDKPFRAGDWVKIGTVEGTVEEVGLRSTRIRTADDSLVTMPNLTLTATAVDNFGARRWRRWRTVLPVAYETSADRIDALCRGIRDLAAASPDAIRQDNVTAALFAMAPPSIDVLVVVYFAAADAATEHRMRHEFALGILRLAERLGVRFASSAPADPAPAVPPEPPPAPKPPPIAGE